MADCESDRERFDITVLVVDDDTTTLSIIASILRSWEYKVATATNAHEALETLREFRGFFDIVVTDLHMRGMNGFELQKHVKQEFQLPVIIMSADSRKSVMSKSLANGAAFYIVKPVSRDDFKDIWQYAVAGRKEKFALENNDLLGSEEGESSPGEKTITSQDSSVLVTEPRRRKKYAKRKGPELHRENITSSGGPKRPKVVWTTSLHNRFLLAIRHIGLNKAVPKRILEIMNAPGLTRENVASHLQKYRIFLRKVAEKGILEGLSERALRSRFASGLPTCLIKDIQKRVGRLRLHDHHHQRPLTITNISGPQPPTPQFPYNPSTTRPSLINQVRLGQSNHFGTNHNYKNFQQPQYHDQANHHRPIVPAYNGNGGLMTSANAMIANGMISTYGSLGNSSNFNYGSTNNTNNNNNHGRLLVPFGSSDLQRSSSTYYNHFATQLNNNASLMAGGMNQGQTGGYINNNNKCSLISNGSASNNANMPVPSSVLNVCVESIQENISGLPPLNQQSINGRNAGGVEHDQYNIISSLTESETPQLNDNLTELFLMIDDMHLLNKREESPRASELSNSDIPSPFNVEECLEQFQGVDDHGNIPTSEGRINVQPNKSSTCTNENPNQLSSDDVFTNLESLDMYSGDKANSSARNSAPHEQDWDIDLIESLFGTVDTS